jgi:hypothetical protein
MAAQEIAYSGLGTLVTPEESVLVLVDHQAFQFANSPTVNNEIHAAMGGVRDSGWGRTGPESLRNSRTSSGSILIAASGNIRSEPLGSPSHRRRRAT